MRVASGNPTVGWITTKKIKLYFPGNEQNAKVWIMQAEEE